MSEASSVCAVAADLARLPLAPIDGFPQRCILGTEPERKTADVADPIFVRIELTGSKFLVVSPGFPLAGVASISGRVFSSRAKSARRRRWRPAGWAGDSGDPHRPSRLADHLAAQGPLALSVLRQNHERDP